ERGNIMCGFIGMIRNNKKQLTDIEREQFKKQNNIIEHRGPDDEGYYHDDYVSFGFRRLSIIDIECGSQPLSYQNDNIQLVFNGEIYNYIELREELVEDGYTFETESDTEVIAALFSKYREEAFSRLRGMFSVLIWDVAEEMLYGVRDPFGIKSLFYYEHDEGVFFASEKKSITTLLEQEERSEEHTSELQSRFELVCRLL